MLDIEPIINNLNINGVSVIPGLYSKSQIDELSQMAQNTYHKTISELSNSNPTPSNYLYYTNYDKEYCDTKNIYDLDKVKVLEVVKGRYDISYKQEPREVHPVIEKITNHFIKTQYNKTWGLLPSRVGSHDGPWHRDVVNIDGDADEDGVYDDHNMVHNMNPFYFNIIIPLVKLNRINGTPEFIQGSHRLTYKESIQNKHIQFNTNIGDAIIFDGRIFHRGRANNSEKDRPVIYNMIHRNWYTETG
jgi:ectoine hydroxylase-related dioxygenase (phytanoyl-CoA dioxygenase family)